MRCLTCFFASHVPCTYIVTMTHGEQNLKMIDDRLREISRQIDSLKAERAELLSMRGDAHVTFAPEDAIAPSFKNLKKLQTLGRTRSLLAKYKEPLSTTALMSLLKEASPQKFNPVTVRSHLRRLRMEGELDFDVRRKTWMPPNSKEPEKE